VLLGVLGVMVLVMLVVVMGLVLFCCLKYWVEYLRYCLICVFVSVMLSSVLL